MPNLSIDATRVVQVVSEGKNLKGMGLKENGDLSYPLSWKYLYLKQFLDLILGAMSLFFSSYLPTWLLYIIAIAENSLLLHSTSPTPLPPIIYCNWQKLKYNIPKIYKAFYIDPFSPHLLLIFPLVHFIPTTLASHCLLNQFIVHFASRLCPQGFLCLEC